MCPCVSLPVLMHLFLLSTWRCRGKHFWADTHCRKSRARRRRSGRREFSSMCSSSGHLFTRVTSFIRCKETNIFFMPFKIFQSHLAFPWGKIWFNNFQNNNIFQLWLQRTAFCNYLLHDQIDCLPVQCEAAKRHDQETPQGDEGGAREAKKQSGCK